MPKSIFIIGGARSGKSHYAQELALKSPQPVLFVATAEAGDDEMQQRIENHRKSRPANWDTLEVTTHIGSKISQKIGQARTVIVDCITLLVNNVFQQHGKLTDETRDASLVEKEVLAEISELTDCINHVKADFIIVSNELGLGLVPADRISRLYRDLLGKANQRLAQRADEVYFLAAGIPLCIKPVKPA
ncbi:bifunctional adenosylcobinamide kinase/adenosylcobinamide-phosphate guanylyltransferase [Chloroflexota bacterium]